MPTGQPKFGSTLTMLVRPLGVVRKVEHGQIDVTKLGGTIEPLTFKPKFQFIAR